MMDQVNMSLSQLRALMVDAAEVGARKALIEVGKIKPFISKSKAEKLYGRPNINSWIEKGLIHPVRDKPGNANYRIDTHELESVSKASNRHSFIKIS